MLEEYVNLYEVWKLQEVGRGANIAAAKYPNIGSDPAPARELAPPPRNISANEIPRYTLLLLTQRPELRHSHKTAFQLHV